MIDIVIPWVNPNDNEWQKDYNYWKEKETGEKNPCRFRDLETFNYWFRAIEKNCPWYRYIFLILASPSQIPSWLNVNHPRLKIVYHKDFIPLKELPTFNSSVINCYVPFIKELSDKYILFNDEIGRITIYMPSESKYLNEAISYTKENEEKFICYMNKYKDDNYLFKFLYDLISKYNNHEKRNQIIIDTFLFMI